MFFQASVLLALVGSAFAARPDNTSICDYYTTALLKNNSAANQYTLLTLVVNTAVIGNYTQPNVGITVPGILAPGMYNGTKVELLPYFNGMLASTNDGGSSGVSQNFLDDGGAAPLMMNKPSNGNKSSNQYMLLTHLYEYFGVLLGCSEVNTTGFPAYEGEASMYEVHKFMALDPYQVGYFITQVGLSAASFGVDASDITAVATALNKLFNYRCSPPTVVVPEQGPQLESICIVDACPLDPAATCAAYEPVVTPMMSNSTMMSGKGNSSASVTMGSPTGSGMGTGSTMTPTSTPVGFKGAAGKVEGGMVAAGAALLAFAL